MMHRKKQFTIYAYASCQKPKSSRNSNTELEALHVASFRFFDEQSSSERDLMNDETVVEEEENNPRERIALTRIRLDSPRLLLPPKSKNVHVTQTTPNRGSALHQSKSQYCLRA